ncbi:hypothetical protein [Fodinibius salsisoli]|uniref:Uncharacterized protein n=1 Tax=Fodinibius salsisoli TaxID=2820877 RepID=A0ABT3PK36_9BACT|nr:hypothetical protein [Fodinibius salsisoli]MCW9706210.1 hypothetical protein [Fodinibius salsisoli]
MNNLSKILQWLSDFEDKEARDEYLESKGYDVNQVGKDGANFIKQQLAERKLKQAQKKKQLLARAQKLVDESDIDTKDLISNTGQGSNFAYQFSKHEDISEEDALEMLTDEQLLRIIEELEKDDE